MSHNLYAGGIITTKSDLEQTAEMNANAGSGYVSTDYLNLYYKLHGGKVDDAMGGLPASQLAVLPATTHFTTLARTDLLIPIVTTFLDAPLPD